MLYQNQDNVDSDDELDGNEWDPKEMQHSLLVGLLRLPDELRMNTTDLTFLGGISQSITSVSKEDRREAIKRGYTGRGGIPPERKLVVSEETDLSSVDRKQVWELQFRPGEDVAMRELAEHVLVKDERSFPELQTLRFESKGKGIVPVRALVNVCELDHKLVNLSFRTCAFTWDEDLLAEQDKTQIVGQFKNVERLFISQIKAENCLKIIKNFHYPYIYHLRLRPILPIKIHLLGSDFMIQKLKILHLSSPSFLNSPYHQSLSLFDRCELKSLDVMSEVSLRGEEHWPIIWKDIEEIEKHHQTLTYLHLSYGSKVTPYTPALQVRQADTENSNKFWYLPSKLKLKTFSYFHISDVLGEFSLNLYPARIVQSSSATLNNFSCAFIMRPCGTHRSSYWPVVLKSQPTYKCTELKTLTTLISSLNLKRVRLSMFLGQEDINNRHLKEVPDNPTARVFVKEVLKSPKLKEARSLTLPLSWFADDLWPAEEKMNGTLVLVAELLHWGKFQDWKKSPIKKALAEIPKLFGKEGRFPNVRTFYLRAPEPLMPALMPADSLANIVSAFPRKWEEMAALQNLGNGVKFVEEFVRVKAEAQEEQAFLAFERRLYRL
ncbi:hypothetical protein T439DRAFT_377583 [Meredithblackwellia eburnea MCA 4105]